MKTAIGALIAAGVAALPLEVSGELYIAPTRDILEELYPQYVMSETPVPPSRSGVGVPLEVAVTMMLGSVKSQVRFESPDLAGQMVSWNFTGVSPGDSPLLDDSALAELASQNGLGFTADGDFRVFASSDERADQLAVYKDVDPLVLDEGHTLKEALELLAAERGSGWTLVWLAPNDGGALGKHWVFEPFLDENGAGAAANLLQEYAHAGGVVAKIYLGNKHLVVSGKEQDESPIEAD